MTDSQKLKNREKAAMYRRLNPDRVREISRRSNEKRRSNPEVVIKIREYQKLYRESNKEKLRDAERQRKFGITKQKYAELFLSQNGVCAICEKPETATRKGVVKALAVDHCHETGKIRGLLCSDCNTGIGKLKEDRKILISAIRYLKMHKTSLDGKEIGEGGESHSPQKPGDRITLTAPADAAPTT